MAKVRFSWALKLSLVLVLSSFLLMSCSRERQLGVFIENRTSDNFRIGGPDGPHVKTDEIKFLTTLTETENTYSVQLWRSYGCIAVIYLSGTITKDTTVLAKATAIIYEPPILPDSNSSALAIRMSDCPSS